MGGGEHTQKSTNNDQLAFSAYYFLKLSMIISVLTTIKKKIKNSATRARLAGNKNEGCSKLRELHANSHRNMLFCVLAPTKHHNLISSGKPWAQRGWQAITIILGKITQCCVIVDCNRYSSLLARYTSLVTTDQSRLLFSSSDMFEAWCSRELGIFLQNRLFQEAAGPFQKNTQMRQVGNWWLFFPFYFLKIKHLS